MGQRHRRDDAVAGPEARARPRPSAASAATFACVRTTALGAPLDPEESFHERGTRKVGGRWRRARTRSAPAEAVHRRRGWVAVPTDRGLPHAPRRRRRSRSAGARDRPRSRPGARPVRAPAGSSTTVARLPQDARERGNQRSRRIQRQSPRRRPHGARPARAPRRARRRRAGARCRPARRWRRRPGCSGSAWANAMLLKLGEVQTIGGLRATCGVCQAAQRSASRPLCAAHPVG